MPLARSEAHRKATPAAMSHLLCSWVFFIIITVAITNEPALVLVAARASSPPPSKLFWYVHADFTSPQSTSTVVRGYDGSETGPGAIRVFNWIVREGKAADSPVLGQTAGQSTVLIDGTIFLEALYILNTSSYAGTISLQGAQPPFRDGEAVIAGGTGDFRFARGYEEIRTVSMENPRDVIFSGTLYIKYD